MTKNEIYRAIKLDVLEYLPVLKNTNTSKRSDKTDDQFNTVLEPLSRAIVLRGTYLADEEKKRIYKLFYRHAEQNYILGLKYVNRVTNQAKTLTRKDINQIELLAKQAMRRWLVKIETVLK
jgi:Zn-dependent oligopeptidase